MSPLPKPDDRSPEPCNHHSSCCHGTGENISTPQSATKASKASSHRLFKITGLDCAEEIAILKRVLSEKVGGDHNLRFNVLRGEMELLVDQSVITTDEIIRAVRSTGMTAQLLTGASSATKTPQTILTNIKLLSTVVSGLLLFIGILLDISTAKSWGKEVWDLFWLHSHEPTLASRIAYGSAALIGTLQVLPKAWYALRSVRPDMNLLMVIAITGAIAINQWSEAATVAFLFSLSLLLEAWSISKARKAIENLIDTQAVLVRVVSAEGVTTPTPAKEVNIGSNFQLIPGERVALDAIVHDGVGTVDESMLTGESLPVLKRPGDKIFAGTINGSVSLKATSIKAADDSRLAHMLRLVNESQSRKALVESWVERFARIYTPIVFLLALLVIVVPTLGGFLEFDKALYNGLALLVIACPCALVISTPVAFLAGLTAAARQGVLIKGGRALEIAGLVQAIALDKTGTLTTGRPEVTDVSAFSGHTVEELLERSVALEAHSDHPLAQAIVTYGALHHIKPAEIAEFTLLPGQGAHGLLKDRLYRVGSEEFQRNFHDIAPDTKQLLARWALEGKSIVVTSSADHLCGAIALSDQLRPEAVLAIKNLRLVGIKKIVLLSGDNKETTNAIGVKAGIDECFGSLMPEDKIKQIDQLLERYSLVAMVGDGINDAPALARASVGIAMGAGTDTALETADIALLSNDLSRLVWLIEHSRRVLRTVRQNIAFAIALKALFAFLAVIGWSSLWGAIAADVGGSLIVIFNGLWLIHPIKPRSSAN